MTMSGTAVTVLLVKRNNTVTISKNRPHFLQNVTNSASSYKKTIVAYGNGSFSKSIKKKHLLLSDRSLMLLRRCQTIYKETQNLSMFLRLLLVKCVINVKSKTLQILFQLDQNEKYMLSSSVTLVRWYDVVM
jgi:hypothetical protein